MSSTQAGKQEGKQAGRQASTQASTRKAFFCRSHALEGLVPTWSGLWVNKAWGLGLGLGLDKNEFC